MVVVRKHCPGFELPAEVVTDCEKPALQNVEALRYAEVVSFTISASRDEIGAVSGELMRRCVRPGHGGLGYAGQLDEAVRSRQRILLRSASQKRQNTAALENVAAVESTHCSLASSSAGMPPRL